MNLFLLLSALATSYLCIAEASDEITDVHKYPWMALIGYSKNDTIQLLCGGSLISDRYVLTAKYCVAGPILESTSPRNVRLGEFDLSNEVDQPDCLTSIEGISDCTEGAVVIPIEKVIPHPSYDSQAKNDKRHDIALIKLSKSAPSSDFIRPISLPTSDMTLSPPSNWQLIEAGWGGIYRPLVSSKVKMEVKLPFVPLSECQAAYEKNRIELWQGHICAGGSGHKSCKGEGGGPLVWENPNGNKVFELVGIVSFGPTPCGKNSIPSVYTKVYEYNSWIQENIKS